MWPAVALIGASDGILGLWGFAVQRSLGAPRWVVPVMIAAWQFPWILAPWGETQLTRFTPRAAFRWIGVVQYLPILVIGLVGVTPLAEHGYGSGNIPLFLAGLFLHFASKIAFVPHRTALFRANLPPHVRGRYYGLLQAGAILALIVAARFGALLLDADARWLRAVFPAAALLGFLGCLQLSRIRWRHERRQGLEAEQGGGWEAMREAFRHSREILRGSRGFRTYETAFMLYGIGLNLSAPLIVTYAEQDLKLTTVAWTQAASLAFPLTQLLGVAIVGRLADALGLLRTTGLAFFVLSGFFGAMFFVASAPALIAVHVLYGIAMAGVDVGWALGPLHFAPEGRARLYMAIHFGLVGVRSAIAPPLGYAIAAVFGLHAAFGCSVVLILLGCVTILRSAAHGDRPAG